jgi:L-malate glycosyltransferase
MKVGILCYPSHGGSGVVATELGKYLAGRGHEVHFINYQQPFRLRGFNPRIFYHEVELSPYPLFKHPPYTIALVNKVAAVIREAGLDLIHAHYAIPHSLCAYLARELVGRDRVKIITTLHGTDITLVGSDPSFREITTFSIQESDAVTAVSRSLAEETARMFSIEIPVRVIYNFVDTHLYRPGSPQHPLGTGRERVLLHISNFRPVKRVQDVIQVFARVREEQPARLVMVGDGIERFGAADLVQELGLKDHVSFLGNQDDVLPLLQQADLFLLPSEKESFGLAALEAMACGLPVVASRTGGIPEVVEEGVSGLLYPVGDTAGMAAGCLTLLQQDSLYRRFAAAARQRAVEEFDSARIIPRYEDLYTSVLQQPPGKR